MHISINTVFLWKSMDNVLYFFREIHVTFYDNKDKELTNHLSFHSELSDKLYDGSEMFFHQLF